MYSPDDGKLAVKIAREVVERHVRRQPIPEFKVPDIFTHKSGVFVTLETYPDLELRGCIGYPEPIFKLINAIQSAAKSAATQDPRFAPVAPRELDKIVVEVSLLTPPELIKVAIPSDLPGQVLVGRDGLIVEKGIARGLLLPQVATEYKWDAEKFLEQTCWKAGLTPDTWLDPDTRVYRFSAEIFTEPRPRAEAVPKKL